MSDALNSASRIFPVMQVIFGSAVQSATDSTSLSLSNLTGSVDFDQTQISITRNSIGNYSLVVTNFGNITGSGKAVSFVNAATTGLGYQCWPNAATYSNYTATFIVQTNTTNLADCGFNFQLYAYEVL